jgi:hypothetical protein
LSREPRPLLHLPIAAGSAAKGVWPTPAEQEISACLAE